MSTLDRIHCTWTASLVVINPTKTPSGAWTTCLPWPDMPSLMGFLAVHSQQKCSMSYIVTNGLSLKFFESLLRLTQRPEVALYVGIRRKGSEKTFRFDELAASLFDVDGWDPVDPTHTPFVVFWGRWVVWRPLPLRPACLCCTKSWLVGGAGRVIHLYLPNLGGACWRRKALPLWESLSLSAGPSVLLVHTTPTWLFVHLLTS